MEKETSHSEELETIKTADLVNDGGILLDVEGRQSSLKVAKDGHVRDFRKEIFVGAALVNVCLRRRF